MNEATATTAGTTVTGPALDTRLAPRCEGALPIEMELRKGLSGGEVQRHLAVSTEFGERSWRYQSFYLLEMEERKLHNATGHSSTAFYAATRLGLDRRRVAELLSVARFLDACPRIDAEVRVGRIDAHAVGRLRAFVVEELVRHELGDLAVGAGGQGVDGGRAQRPHGRRTETGWAQADRTHGHAVRGRTSCGGSREDARGSVGAPNVRRTRPSRQRMTPNVRQTPRSRQRMPPNVRRTPNVRRS